MLKMLKTRKKECLNQILWIFPSQDVSQNCDFPVLLKLIIEIGGRPEGVWGMGAGRNAN